MEKAMQAKIDFLSEFKIAENYSNNAMDQLVKTDSRYLRDLKMNYKSSMNTAHLSEKEAALIALAIAVNENNAVLSRYFMELSADKAANRDEISEAIACSSLLSSNNVLYRFRHFTAKDAYKKMPAKLRMNLMLNPANGQAFFELLSLAVSAVNACELCVNSHEASLIELGVAEEKIFDAIRLSSVIVSLSKILY